MSRKIHTCTLLSVLFLAACTHGPKDNIAPVAPFVSYENIVFGTDTVEQAMDVYLPQGRDSINTPVVILIHGGAWVTGDKSDFNGLGLDTFFNNNGCALVNMNYRLDMTYKYPAPVDDIGLVMAYITKNAGKWKINPNRICLFGRSSGSQLAMIYAYTRNQDNRIKAVVDGFGPTALTDSTVVNTMLGGNVAYMLGTYAANTQTWQEASPANYTSNAVPTIIFQGSLDSLVYPKQSQLLQDSLTANGVPCQYITWPGVGHGWDQDDWLAWRTSTMDWLRKFL